MTNWKPGARTPFMLAMGLALAALVVLAARVPAQTPAQAAVPGASHPSSAERAEARHMEMTPAVAATAADSARAWQLVRTLRVALAPYRDTSAAVAAGYHMFAPQMKQQKVYHFTSNWRAVEEAFRFDPARPTSLLYTKAADGRFILVGAMYTAPKRFSPDKLDARVPLSIARWHKHVNWCVPRRGASERWLERRDGQPVFGPESPIDTRAACDTVHGTFHDTLFGWMVHANVFAGDDLASIWGGEHGGHAGHDMHEGMTMDAMHGVP